VLVFDNTLILIYTCGINEEINMLSNIFWKPFAWFVSRQPVANFIIEHAKKTPYFHLDGYMERWWLFNDYTNTPKHLRRLPSIRIHHILRKDLSRDMHDHPWDARTIILRGGYWEDRLIEGTIPKVHAYKRQVGDTATLKFGEFHNIVDVSEGGVWTMFITFKYRGTWGFRVNGEKVPHFAYEYEETY